MGASLAAVAGNAAGEDCLRADTVAALLGGWLNEGERERVEAHIDDCAACRELLSELARSDAKACSDIREHDGGREHDDTRVAVLPMGMRVGRYRLDSFVGAGGMGVVYEAHDPDLHRKVALKVVRGDAASADWKVRLMREAQAMARLSHPNVVTIYDVVLHEDRLFIAMEFVQGVSLRRWLRQERRSWREVLQVFLQAGDGLAAAHAVGLVHRDFKPDNVLCDGQAHARVTDFGLARSASLTESEAAAGALEEALDPLGTPVTQTGQILGTPAYMSPEQHDGNVADERSDQWSFCMALWEGLYGESPFGGGSYRDLADAVRRGDLRAPPKHATVPPRIRSILTRGLSVAAGSRYPTMGVLLTELRRPLTRPVPWFAWAAGAGFLLATGVVLAFRYAHPASTAQTKSIAIVAPAAAAASVMTPKDVASTAAPAAAIEEPLPATVTRAMPSAPVPPSPHSRAAIGSARPQSGAAEVNCDPPFTVDGSGLKHYKPQCDN